MMSACLYVLASEEAENKDHHIVMAKPLRAPESIRKSRKTEIVKWVERGFAERWWRAESLKIGVSFSEADGSATRSMRRVAV